MGDCCVRTFVIVSLISLFNKVLYGKKTFCRLDSFKFNVQIYFFKPISAVVTVLILKSTAVRTQMCPINMLMLI